MVIEKHLISQLNFTPLKRELAVTKYQSHLLILVLYHTLDRYQLLPCPSDHERQNEIQQYATHMEGIISDQMAIMRVTVEWYHEKYDHVDGFDSEEEVEEEIVEQLPVVEHDSKRVLTIYVWGKRHRHYPQFSIDRNFNAAVLHGKKSGVDWRKDGRCSEIREAVKKCPGYPRFMSEMVRLVERDDCHRIGINRAAGRHRSVTCAIELMKYYPEAILHFLELR